MSTLHAPQKSRSLVITLAALAAFIATAPHAAAENMGFGSPDTSNIWSVLGLVALGLAGLGFFAARKFKKIPVVSAIGPWGLLAAGLIVSASVNPGGAFADDSPDAATSVADAVAAANKGEIYSDTTVTFSVRELYDSTGIASADVQLYLSSHGWTDKQLLEESVTPEYTCATAATFDCSITVKADLYDIVVTKANFYQLIERGVDTRKAKTAFATSDTATMSLPTLKVMPQGAFDTGDMDTTYNINTASSTYTVFFRNSDTDGYIVAPAFKVSGETNVVIDSIATGQPCELVDISGTLYVQYTGGDKIIGPSQTETCIINFSTTAATSDFSLTGDDLFRFYDGLNAFATNSNVEDMAAASAVDVADAA